MSEIEPFPCSVLQHHYPEVPNYGDMTKFKDWPDATINVLVGGTPCQSFSVAGLRKGLADPRGNLMLTYLAIAEKYRPEWLVWENVPGVLSSNGGRDFGSFLGGLAELGYGFAYRILDAQFFGVAQRRRRVFVVGCAGSWQRAAAVLFERHSLSGHPAPRRKKGEGVAPILEGGARASRSTCGTITARMFNALGARDIEEGAVIEHSVKWPAEVASTLNAHYGDKMGLEDQHALNGASLFVPTTDNYVAHSLRGSGFDASEDGTGRGTPLVPIAFSAKNHSADAGELAPTLRAGGHANSHANAGVMPAIAFGWQNSSQQGASASASHTPTLDKSKVPAICSALQVRRLTHVECARLQGFPDDYLDIIHRGKPAADGPKYKALGNSMAVPCMAWIGRRIAMVAAHPRGSASE